MSNRLRIEIWIKDRLPQISEEEFKEIQDLLDDYADYNFEQGLDAHNL